MALPQTTTPAHDATSEPPGRLLPDLAAFARPRIRQDVPILWRTQTSIQLGDDVVVERVSRSLVAWLTSIDGLQSPQVIEESLTIPDHEARRLVRALLAAGALEDAACIPDPLRWAQQPRRDELAAEFGAALRTYRDRERAFAVMEARDRCRVVVVGDGRLSDEVRTSLEGAGLAIDAAHPAIAVLADAPHPDVPAHFDTPLLDLPHLHVGTLGERATIGPLVVPGRTPCLRCGHLHRRDADSAWPLLAVQWAQAQAGLAAPPVDPLLAGLAAVHAALLLRTWIDRPEEPEAWSGFAYDLRLPFGLAQRLERPAHPLCGCLWLAA